MKQKLLLPALIAAIAFTSCNGDGASSNGSTDTTVSTTTTNSTDTGSTSTGPGTSNAGATTTTGTPLNEADQAFVRKAAMGGTMEVQAGQVAQQNGQHERVKAFASMMVNDHTNANNELKQLATSRGLMLTDSVDAKMQQHMTAMQKMQGKAFDKHYMDMMVNDHSKTIADFEKAASGANDPDLKAWAAKMLPALKMHKDSATAINKAIK
ncbi:DUF4142 domain-containing protein [Flaviaesturariibacter amylovorans]|uniref:DUF4142 domain-containing protein n=1 Tax=Flaviaesturariibacter amylovorans TaxID=1084520 RepID=A0ABP8GPB0_9BACT